MVGPCLTEGAATRDHFLFFSLTALSCLPFSARNTVQASPTGKGAVGPFKIRVRHRVSHSLATFFLFEAFLRCSEYVSAAVVVVAKIQPLNIVHKTWGDCLPVCVYVCICVRINPLSIHHWRCIAIYMYMTSTSATIRHFAFSLRKEFYLRRYLTLPFFTLLMSLQITTVLPVEFDFTF